jgi:FAD/FMN-containing dehydrogenase
MLRSDNYKVFNDAVISTVVGPLGLNKNEELVIQDIEIPISRSAEWIKEFLRVCPSQKIGKIKLSRPGSKETTVPIWLNPMKATEAPLLPMDKNQLYINFGFWDACVGKETKGGLEAGNINRNLETLTENFKGKKTLYSSVFLSEDQFMAQYNGAFYKKIKKEYDKDGRLRGWYERVTKA